VAGHSTDYRDAPASFAPFSKIASVGMFEHVGMQNLPRYFRTVHGMLKPGGVFLNHGIARATSARDRDGTLLGRSMEPFLNWIPQLRRANNSAFMDKYVFPDGELVTISEALQVAESVGFEVRDVENLREHYNLTLRAWVERLQSNAAQILKLVSAITYRTWLLYMAGSAAAFRRGDIAVYQTLLTRSDHGRCGLPLSRGDWYIPRHPSDLESGPTPSIGN
jgi:cyclopropane-fatty-acyl-phospholipid synthase